jgi:hypothetical protein
MKKLKEFKSKWPVFLFSLLAIFVMPFVSFATSFSDFQPGNMDNTIVGNTLQMSLDSRRSIDSEGADYHRLRNEQRGQPQTTPTPSAVWLLGTGLIGLFGISRKLKK